MQEMPQNGTGVQGDLLLGIIMQEQQPQVMPTSPPEGHFAAALSTAAACAAAAAVLPCAQGTSCLAPAGRSNSLKLCQHLH